MNAGGERDGHRVILLPGAVLPKDLAYGAFLAALDDEVSAHAKDLEVYAVEPPPPEYGIDTEIAGIMRDAEARGFDRFHLVGYSAGGAISAAFAARHRDRVLSLALLEPAWLGDEGMSPEEQEVRAELKRLDELPANEMLPRFVRAQLAPGVEPPPPPPGPTPDWMSSRPAGIAALLGAFDAYELDNDDLRAFTGPVYYALGSLSRPALYGSIAERAAGLFSDFTLDVYEGRHHFDPPHRVEAARLARRVAAIWDRAGAR
jgi:pimeloyl-ACP methyl ester carboxylesterase